MQKRIYVVRAGNFKQVTKKGRADKWASGRWAKMVGSTGIEKAFEENFGEMTVTLADGESVTYVKGWDTKEDIKQVFTANFKTDTGRFVQFN